MKTVKLVCDCCGKEFTSEYYGGGYNDHVLSFSNNRHKYMKYKYPAERLAHDIMFYGGNKLRYKHVVRDLLDCCMSWGCIPNNVKADVKSIVEQMIFKIEQAEEEADKVKQTMSPMALALLTSDEFSSTYQNTFVDVAGVSLRKILSHKEDEL